jgi:hypothetical protein
MGVGGAGLAPPSLQTERLSVPELHLTMSKKKKSVDLKR